MQEIEVKILDTNHNDLKPKLIALGAKKISNNELHAIFFDTEDSKIKNSNEVFRLRNEGPKTFITHKKKIQSNESGDNNNIKIREETEVEVSNFYDTKKILNSIGLKETASITKTRTSYKLNNTKFEFDKFHSPYDFVPEFLEIEAPTIEEVHHNANLLGFSKEDCKPWSQSEIIGHYKNQK